MKSYTKSLLLFMISLFVVEAIFIGWQSWSRYGWLLFTDNYLNDNLGTLLFAGIQTILWLVVTFILYKKISTEREQKSITFEIILFTLFTPLNIWITNLLISSAAGEKWLHPPGEFAGLGVLIYQILLEVISLILAIGFAISLKRKIYTTDILPQQR